MTDLLPNKSKLGLLASLLILASLLLVVLSFLGHPPPWLKVVKEILLFLTIFLLPGYLLGRHLFPTAGFDRLEKVPLYFSLGVAFWSILGLAYFYLYLPLDYTIGLFLVILIALAVKQLFSKRDLAPAIEDTFSVPQGTMGWYYFVLLAMMATFSVLLWKAAPFQQVDFDTYFHLAGVRKIAQSNVWLNADQFLGNGAPAQLPYAANSWYLMLAVFSRISQVDITEIYVTMSVLLTIVAVLAFYLVVKTLLGSKFLSLIATITYAFYLFVIYTYQVSRVFTVLYPTFLPYPGEMLRFIIFPVIFAVLVKYILSGQNRFLFVLALLATTLVTVHLQFVIYMVLTLGALGLVFLFLVKKYRQHFFRTFIAALVVGAMSSVFLLPKILLANSNVASSYMELPFWLNPDVAQRDYLFITKDWYLLNFNNLFARTGVHFLVSLLVLPLIFLPRFKVDRLRALLFTSVAVLLLIIYNPLVVPLLVKTVSWVIPRRIAFFSHWTIYLAVSFSIFALLITYPQRALREDRKLLSKPALLPLVIIILLATFIVSLPMFSLPIAQAVNNEGQYANILDMPKEDLFQFLNKEIEPESVIAADLETSYLIGALTSHYVIALTPNRMGVGGEQALMRLIDALNISSLNLPPEELRAAMNRYGSKYIVIPSALGSGNKWEALAGSFKTSYDSAGWKVLAVR